MHSSFVFLYRFLFFLGALSVFNRDASAQAYGLETRQPVGAYLNGVFPDVPPGTGGTWGTTNAFPNLTFPDPISLVPEPGSNRLWVACRQGTVWRFENNPATTAAVKVLDLTAQTQGWDDCGLLGLAFHPQFGQAGSPNRGYIYVYYNYSPAPVVGNHTNGVPDDIRSYNRLSRFTIADGATVVDPASELVLINQYDEQLWHNGGDLFFGNDGFLYLVNGDEGWANDHFNNGQKINASLFAGVMRIDVDRDATRSHPIRRQPLPGGTPPAGWPATYSQNYFIPNDNPWQDTAGGVLEEFWAIGTRSPHRMTLDRPTGRIFIGDVGQGAREEISLATRGGNMQWPYREGNIAGPKAKPNPLIGTDIEPLWAYDRTQGGCVIGGYVYRGTRHLDVVGEYIFGDHNNGNIWAMKIDGVPSPQVRLLTNVGAGGTLSGLSSFGVDHAGEIYLMMLGANGRILKFTRSGGAAAPSTLSATGAFSNLATLQPAPGLIPYAVNSPLWSDGAHKQRWIAVPTAATIQFNAIGEWVFPAGTVLVKHFELPVDDANPSIRKRMETRFLVRDKNGGVYGLTYRWRADGTDADLLTAGLNEPITIAVEGGGERVQNWTFPSRADCITCHTPAAGHVLGVKTRQLNGSMLFPNGVTDNQLRAWNKIGLFTPALNESAIPGYTRMVPISDATATLETRVRSYLDANCAHCHRPGGSTQALFDARFDTPLASQGLVNGNVLNNLGLLGAKVIKPQRPELSSIYLRMDALDAIAMPPLAKNRTDDEALVVLEEWILSLKGDVPEPWKDEPVGNATTGGSSVAAGVFAIEAGGTGFDGASDAFRFLHQPQTGNAEITARVTALSGGRAGVMIRETTAPGSRFFFAGVSAGKFIVRFRSTTGATATSTTYTTVPAEGGWVKVVRNAGTFYAYTSPDGVTWTQVRSRSFTMASTARIGLAATAQSSTTTITATIDKVTVGTATPTIALNLPSTLFETPGIVRLAADVASNGHPIRKVQFHRGTTLIGEDTSAPYSFDWLNPAVGSYAITATVIYGQLARTVATASQTITVSSAPTITLTAPSSGANFTTGTNVTLAASVTANGSSIERVDFLIDGSMVASDATAPYQTTWAASGTGSRIATARVIYNGTAQRDSTGVTFSVTSPVILPTITLTAPVVGTTYMAPASIMLAASVNANGNTISKVQFFNANTLLGEDATAPYEWTWSGVSAGNYTLSARVFSSAGNVDAAPVSITVNAPTQGGSGTVGPWAWNDIGAVGSMGGASYLGGELTISAAGSGLSGTSDAFNLVAESLNGDGEITARLIAVSSPSVFAGLTVRETTSPSSRHATLGVLNGNFQLISRAATADVTSQINGGAAGNQPWLRLIRTGNIVAGFRSADGSVWAEVSRATVPMASVLSIGFGVASGASGITASARFDNIRIATRAPVCDLFVLTPPPFNAGGAMDLEGSIVDFGHTIQRVQFFNGTTLLGEKLNSAPWSFRWLNLPRGTHQLRCVAHYGIGGTTQSSIVTITVP